MGIWPIPASRLGRSLPWLRAARPPACLPLTFAAVFGFSTHIYLLGEWLEQGGLKLGEDIRFEVVPPPQTVEALASGRIDGFCAGRALECGGRRGRRRRDGPCQRRPAPRLP